MTTVLEIDATGLVLHVEDACVETTARRAHRVLFQRTLVADPPPPELSRAITLLHDFLACADFGRMRAADADLSSGRTGLRVRISRTQDGSIVWEKQEELT